MKIETRFIYKMIPVPVVITNWLIPKRFDALSLGVLILIRPSEKNNKGLLQHELTHSEQFYRTFGIQPFLYFFSEEYRYQYELEAWRVQLDYNENDYEFAVDALVNNYNLLVTENKVRNEL